LFELRIEQLTAAPGGEIICMALVGLLGLAVGSFLNVVIYRLPRRKSLIRPRSSCPGCGSEIRWYHNVPLLSYLMLRGRCRQCGVKISPRYPLVEACTALLFLFFFWRYGLSVTTVGFWLFGAALLAVFFIDLEHQLIPDMITIPGVGVGVVLAVVSDHLSVLSSLTGVLAGGGSFLLLAWVGQRLFKKESLGGGDIKLAAMMGAFVGPLRIFLVFVLSAVLGLLVSLVVLMISTRFRRERLLPFGPFLVLAALLVVFYGQEALTWYWQHFLSP
jgi:leader peptidase (prepilin peptidase)/N-methyltransferase